MTWLVVAWATAVAQDDLSTVLERLGLRISADETEVVGDAQILTGEVRVEVLSKNEQVVLTLRAGRAERRGQELKVQQGVRLEASQEMTGAGLGSLLNSHGLALNETLVEAESVYLHAGRRMIEIHQLDARAAGKHDGDSQRITLRAEHVSLTMDDDGSWRSRMTKPRAGLRFD